jgi:NAD(P)H dehydrogenase (quinone)
MKVLIVLAHPEPRSFNAELSRAAEEVLRRQGHDVKMSDLYRVGFAPDEHERHFVQRKDPSRFDAQTEQRFNTEQATLPAEIHQEIEKILWADVVMFQFPLWWFGVPAILKGWMDRVFAYGALYQGSQRLHTGICRGKRAVLSVTAGSSADACAYDGQEGDTSLILWPIHYSLHYVGFTVLEPRIMTAIRPTRANDNPADQAQYLRAQLLSHRDWVLSLRDIPVISFNSAEDWDERRKLTPAAPVYSPFIRHRADWKMP